MSQVYNQVLNELKYCLHDSWNVNHEQSVVFFYRGLLTSVKHCATWVSATQEQVAIQKCFRSLEYMFKFIIESRFLFARATGNQFEDSFKRDLLSVMTALNNMLVRTYDVIMPTQVTSILNT